MERTIWSRRDADRDTADNDGTLCLAPSALWARPSASRASFESVFRAHYEPLRRLLQAHPSPGLALLAATDASLEATAWFEAGADDIHPLIVGRHASADLYLPSDPGVSLRHLALLLHRRGPEERVRFTVLDLRTPLGFTDEDGAPQRAVAAEGPLLLRCGAFALLLIPTGDSDASWPSDPGPAWACIPPREWRPADSRALAPEARAFRWSVGASTMALTWPGPSMASWQANPADPARGDLVVQSPGGRGSIPLGPTASRYGVLLGRYERCDGGGPPLSDPRLSRVHALVTELDGTLYAIDAGSKNGCWLGGQRVRGARLQPGVRLTLAADVQVDWRPYH